MASEGAAPPAPTSPVGRRKSIDSSILNDPTFRGLAYQALLVIVLVAFVGWLTNNVMTNMNRNFNFGFLWQSAGFSISFTLIPWDRTSLYLHAYIAGILNTLLVAVIGIVFATLLGFVMGIARLSSNWIVRKLSMVYIEVVRNVPLLLQLLFWYFLALNALPVVRESIEAPGGFVLNRRGLYLPTPVYDERFIWVIGAAVLAVILAYFWRRHALRKTVATGQRQPIWLPILGIVAALLAASYVLSGTQLSFDRPELTGFNYTGGFALPPELTALVLGLVVYTAAFIAEVVRAGIQAVSHGQVEAASALGLREGDRLRLVVIPQAMRVIVPPLTSQYLNLTKNSSLGAAIGFPELVNVFVGTSINQSGRAIEIIALTMLVYLTFSLATSLFMNWYNARIALVER